MSATEVEYTSTKEVGEFVSVLTKEMSPSVTLINIRSDSLCAVALLRMPQSKVDADLESYLNANPSLTPKTEDDDEIEWALVNGIKTQFQSCAFAYCDNNGDAHNLEAFAEFGWDEDFVYELASAR